MAFSAPPEESMYLRPRCSYAAKSTFVSSFTLCVYFLLAFIQPGEGLDCFVCNSHRNSTCSSKGENNPALLPFLQSCEPTYTMCRLTVQSGFPKPTDAGVEEEKERVIRQCARLGAVECKDFKTRAKVQVAMCTCATDKCNAGNQMSPRVPVCAAMLAVTSLLKKLFN